MWKSVSWCNMHVLNVLIAATLKNAANPYEFTSPTFVTFPRTGNHTQYLTGSLGHIFGWFHILGGFNNSCLCATQHLACIVPLAVYSNMHLCWLVNVWRTTSVEWFHCTGTSGLEMAISFITYLVQAEQLMNRIMRWGEETLGWVSRMKYSWFPTSCF